MAEPYIPPKQFNKEFISGMPSLCDHNTHYPSHREVDPFRALSECGVLDTEVLVDLSTGPDHVSLYILICYPLMSSSPPSPLTSSLYYYRICTNNIAIHHFPTCACS